MIVATAGHVDHGKTSLIKSLTGVETDRLEEEKRRGLTIDLGFAYRRVNDKVTLGFIDVPGHSRFINTMIAGVSGIDLGMLVVAADDGPMPQTLEHIDVMRLLGITEFVLVVSKIDRVVPERIEEVGRVLRSLVPECGREVFTLSNSSQQGVTELQSYLDKTALAFKSRSTAGNFRLHVDRAFRLKGVGLVVTGTAATGQITSGEELEVLPAGGVVRIRSLRVQDNESALGVAGDRCALNIVGADDVHRGSTLASVGSLHSSKHLDVRFSLLQSAPFSLKHLSPVKLYIGTRRLPCRMYFIESIKGGRITPGKVALVQLILEEAVTCCTGDRFLIRDHSESITLGGGVVLDPVAPKTGKSRRHRLDYLAAMELPSPEDRLAALLRSGTPPLDNARLAKSWNLRPEELEQLLGKTTAKQFEVASRAYAISREDWAVAEETLLALVQQWHEQNSQLKGISVLELQTQFLRLNKNGSDKILFKAVLTSLLGEGELGLVGGLIQSARFKPLLSSVDQSHWEVVRQVLKKRALIIPSVQELAELTGLEQEKVRNATEAAARIKLVHKVQENRYALSEHLLAHAKIVSELGQEEEGITVIAYKNRIGTGRKLAIDILEYFDAVKYTRRSGDSRLIIDTAILDNLFGK